MKKILLILGLLGLGLYGCTSPPPNHKGDLPRLSPKQLQADFKEMMRLLQENHPGLSLYHSPEYLRRRFQGIEAQLDKEMDVVQFYRLLAPALAAIRCGHTKISLPPEILAHWHHQYPLFPFRVRILGQRFFVHSSPQSGLSKGTEIRSINGQKVKDIIKHLSEQISTLSDGFNQSGKLRYLEENFAIYFTLFYPSSGKFKIEFISPGTSAIMMRPFEGINPDQYKQMIPSPEPYLRFINLPDLNLAILKISSLDKNQLDQQKLEFKTFLRDSFRTLKKQNIEHLVLDLRHNKGGDMQYASILLSYLISKDFQIHTEIQRSKNEALEKDPRLTLAVFLGKSFIQPNDLAFEGKILVLVNGMTFSGAADVAALLHANRSSSESVFFVGEETGGAYQGNCSGILPSFSLGHSRLKLRIPLWKFRNKVDPQVFRHRGLLPDKPILPTPADFRAGIDTEMRFAFDYFGHPASGI